MPKPRSAPAPHSGATPRPRRASTRPSVRPARGSVPSPLLTYAVGTAPIPLQISTSGSVTVIASNPGGYSDQPGTDFVTVTQIVLNFGEIGADASDLTTADGAGWQVTGPAGWDAPTVEGVEFTFRAPNGGENVFPDAGLTFVFSGFSVNAKVGSVLLTIPETASAPGDPAQPDLYPPIASQLGVADTLLGKFPVDFSLSPPVASPPNVNAGESTTISWSGTPGALYTLSFGRETVTTHADGTALAADDHYPNQARLDAPLALTSDTTFTLTVQYTPPGGSDAATMQAQVTVAVNFPNPSVTSFTVSPDFLPGLGGGPATVLLAWQTANGSPPSPVSFSVDPPLSADEVQLNLDNDLFNTSHLASAQAGFTFTQGHRLTLQVVGPSGTTPATQTARLLGCQPGPGVATVPQAPTGMAFTRDGKHLIVSGAAAGSGWSVFDVSTAAPATWPVSYLAGDYSYAGVATTPDGKYALSSCAMAGFPTGTAAVVAIEIVAGQPGANWPKTLVPLPLPAEFVAGGDIAISPDGRYAFAAVPQGMAVVTIPPGATPANWTATGLGAAGQVAFSADSKYAIVASPIQTQVFAIDPALPPGQWTSTVVATPADDVVVTHDSQYAILVHTATNSLSVLTIVAGVSPAEWVVTPVTVGMEAPAQINLSPDGTLAFLTPAAFTAGPIAMLELSGAPSNWTGTVFGEVRAAAPGCAVTPDGQYLLVMNANSLLPFQFTPPLAASAAIAIRPSSASATMPDTAPSLGAGNTPLTLLDYAVSTLPLPLQISTPGVITIVASNPGDYSDQPAQDYVAVNNLVLDFGLKGGDAADLTTVDGSSLTVTPPSGWPAPSVAGLRFTFTPPVAGANLFPPEGLTFIFANVPVNAVVGTATLTITEVASSPGNPAEPDLYPPQPKASRVQLKGLGKFPANFTVGDLIARPANVPIGGGPVLSWSGTPGAAYELDFGTTKITQHANQLLLQATDVFPNPVAADSALSLQDPTVFTLNVAYTPPGSGTPAMLQRQVSVGVNYPGPSIDAFTILPPWALPGQTTPTQVTITWQTAQGAGEGPVGFALDPPLSAAEVAANAGNNFFNTPHTGNGQGTFNFLQGHRVTLTVVGHAGTTPATRTLHFLSFQVLPGFTGGVDVPLEMVFTRDGRYGVLVNVPNDSGPALTIVDRHGGPPAHWTVTGLFPGGSLSGVVVTPDDRAIITMDPKTLYVITIDPTTSPQNWPIAKMLTLTGAMSDEVAISPSGRYLYLGGIRGLFVIDMGPGLPHSQWIPVPIIKELVQELLVTPDGRYLLGTRTSGGGQTTDVIVVQVAEGTRPQTWKISSLDLSDTWPTGASPDGRYIFVAPTGSGAVAAIDTQVSADPAQWTVAPMVTGNGNGQVAGAVATPDNQFVFFARSADLDGKNAAFGIARVVPDTAPHTWPSAVLGTPASDVQTYYLAGVTPDGRYLLAQSGQNTLTPLAVTPVLEPARPSSSRHLLRGRSRRHGD